MNQTKLNHTKMNTNPNNSHEAIATDTVDTSGSRSAVETPITLPRPHSNGDEKLTGSPPNQGAAKKRRRKILAAAAALIVALAAGVYYFRFVLPLSPPTTRSSKATSYRWRRKCRDESRNCW